MRRSIPEFHILMALALAAGALWIFLEVIEDVVVEGPSTIDRAILLAFRDPSDPAKALGPHWLPELARDLTALGSYGVLTLVTVAAAVFLVLVQRYHAAWRLTAAIACGAVLVNLLKLAFGRPRPDIVPLPELTTPSFPSGHAAMSAIVYLTIAALIARVLPDFRTRAYVVGLGIFVTVLVGLTRIYLGVHWPSDVLGGWALGAAWALVWWAVAEWFRPERLPGAPR